MPTRSFLTLGAFVLAAVVASSYFASPAAGTLPPPDAQALWNYISSVSPYTDWRFFPGTDGLTRVGEEPHGDWVRVYVNGAAHSALSKPASPFFMPYGSIMVKENFALNPDDPGQQPRRAQLLSLTVMYKVRGFHTVADQNEWFWVMFGCPGGRCGGSVVTISQKQGFINETIPGRDDTFADFLGETQAGKPWFCLQCHSNARNTTRNAFGDYVWRLKPFEVSP